MPTPPSYIDQVNFITRWFSNTCSAPWVVYFETALPAAGNALLTLLAFGWDDVVRGYFKPRGLRSQRHGRKGRKGRRRGGGLPEFGELLGANLPGAERMRQRNVTQGVKNLWIIDGVIQRVLFYWLVVDVVLEFGYQWISAIYEDPRLDCDTNSRAMRSEAETTWLSLTGWTGFSTGTIDYEEGDLTTFPNGASLQDGEWLVTISCDVQGDTAGPMTAELRIQNTTGGAVTLATSSESGIRDGETRQLLAVATVSGPVSIGVERRVVGGRAIGRTQVTTYNKLN